MKLINYAEMQTKLVKELDKLPTYIKDRYGFTTYCQHNASMRGGIHKALKCLEQCQMYVATDGHTYGKWIISSDGCCPYCSECKNEPQSGIMTNYCPSCGAEMVVTNTLCF